MCTIMTDSGSGGLNSNTHIVAMILPCKLVLSVTYGIIHKISRIVKSTVAMYSA